MVTNEKLNNTQKLYIILIYSLPFYTISFAGLSVKDVILLILLGYYFVLLIKFDLSFMRDQLITLLLILLLFLLSIVSLTNAPDINTSFRASISIINIFILVFITFNIIKTECFFFLVIKTIYIMSILVALLGIIQVISYELLGINLGGFFGYPFILQTDIRSTAFFSNPNLYGFFLHFGHSLSLSILILYKGIRIIPYSFKIILINHFILLLAIIASGSKGATLSLIIATLVIFLVVIVKKKMFSILLVTLALPIALIIFNIREISKSIFQDNGESNTRLDFWEYTLRMFNEKPFLGYGMDSFREVTSLNTIPHNLYLQTLSENGLLGLLVLIFIFVSSIYFLLFVCLKTIYNEYFLISTALFGALIEMLVHSISLSAFNNVMLWLCISLIGTNYFVFKKEGIRIYDKGNDISRSSN
ncbi:O-antigen ligase [Sporosarcina sp. ZBG7A]|uniref:O-antigen ligase family protein n=1 Tax=Sporosarcina sp. ZBG7A TaxID=1582223 RepID=UPI00057AAECF|nr:O-antigen ligase family protein [Sporosarcina sp. ZBG7A]